MSAPAPAPATDPITFPNVTVVANGQLSVGRLDNSSGTLVPVSLRFLPEGDVQVMTTTSVILTAAEFQRSAPASLTAMFNKPAEKNLVACTATGGMPFGTYLSISKHAIAVTIPLKKVPIASYLIPVKFGTDKGWVLANPYVLDPYERNRPALLETINRIYDSETAGGLTLEELLGSMLDQGPKVPHIVNLPSNWQNRFQLTLLIQALSSVNGAPNPPPNHNTYRSACLILSYYDGKQFRAAELGNVYNTGLVCADTDTKNEFSLIEQISTVPAGSSILANPCNGDIFKLANVCFSRWMSSNSNADLLRAQSLHTVQLTADAKTLRSTPEIETAITNNWTVITNTLQLAHLKSVNQLLFPNATPTA